MECTTGLYAWFIDSSVLDCVWNVYEPTLPLYTMSFFDKYDNAEDWMPWQCVNKDFSEYPEDTGDDGVIVIQGDGVFTGARVSHITSPNDSPSFYSCSL